MAVQAEEQVIGNQRAHEDLAELREIAELVLYCGDISWCLRSKFRNEGQTWIELLTLIRASHKFIARTCTSTWLSI